jgi:hypothetical protein
MAASPVGNGYWLVTADGKVYPYGGAASHGDASTLDLYAPIVAMAATPDGKGYWLAAQDGGVFAFGDARFAGSAGSIRLAQPIVGMAATADGKGYWLVAADGGIFCYGDAPFYGSAGNLKLFSAVVGMAVGPGGHGYWMVAGDGGMFAYGSAGFHGGLGGPPDAKGYWLLEPDAFPTHFSHPSGGSSVVLIAASQVAPNPDAGHFCNPYGPCEPWCALFATWVWRQAGIHIPQLAFVGDVYDWAARYTHVLPASARPRPDDFVLYGTGPANVHTAVHMGVVTQVWPDGAIDTVEGDVGPGANGFTNVEYNLPFLPSNSVEYNGMPIFAYVVP